MTAALPALLLPRGSSSAQGSRDGCPCWRPPPAPAALRGMRKGVESLQSARTGLGGWEARVSGPFASAVAEQGLQCVVWAFTATQLGLRVGVAPNLQWVRSRKTSPHSETCRLWSPHVKNWRPALAHEAATASPSSTHAGVPRATSCGPHWSSERLRTPPRASSPTRPVCEPGAESGEASPSCPNPAQC